MKGLNRRDVLKLTPVAALSVAAGADKPSAGAEPASVTPQRAVNIRLRVGESCWVKEGTTWHTHTEVSPYADVSTLTSSGYFYLGLRFGDHSQVHFPERVGGETLTDVAIHVTRSDDHPGLGGKKKRKHVKLKSNGDVDSRKDEDTGEIAVFIEPWYDGKPFSAAHDQDTARSCCVSCGDTTVCGPAGATCIMCNGTQICC